MSKRTKLAPLPRVTSKTITVGALLGKIKRLILAEPKRLDMGAWVSMFKGESIYGAQVAASPACGTVACMAGWGATLLRSSDASGIEIEETADDAMNYAIGYDEPWGRTVGGLFDPDPIDDESLPPAGTLGHAEVIAERIDTYLSQHPEIVKRKIVVADIQKMLRA